MDNLMVDYGHNVPLDEYQVYRYVRFSNSTLKDLHIYNKSFIECIFSDLSFIGCTFADCTFIGGYVAAAQFENCVFMRCTFDTLFISHTSIRDSHTLECKVENCAFHHSYFLENTFRDDHYIRCSFNSCDERKSWRMYCHAEECFGLELTCPESGSFIGWKRLQGDIIAKLEIPADARRTSGFSRKCRADAVFVLGFYNSDGTKNHDVKSANSLLYPDFTYTLGKMALADSFDAGRDTCGHGIHFYLSFQEAVEYKSL